METAILEKWLICDPLEQDGKEKMCAMLDLKACYDRQLPSLGYLAEELVGVKRKPANYLQKYFLR